MYENDEFTEEEDKYCRRMMCLVRMDGLRSKKIPMCINCLEQMKVEKCDYRQKTVRGFIDDNTKSVFPMAHDVTVRLTNDEKGQTLSLQCFNVLIGIPLEDVSDIVKMVEKEKKE